MKHLKHYLTVLGISSLIGINIAQAASYVIVQVGRAKSHPIHAWVRNEKKYLPARRVAAGIKGDVTSAFQVGVEVGAQKYKKKSKLYGASKMSSKRWSLDELVVADVYLTRNIDIIAKAGVAYVVPKAQIDFIQDNGKTTTHRLKTSPYFVPKGVLGVGYNVSKKINVNFSVEHEFAKKGQQSVNSLLMGVKYHL